jgi:hypothetical protein
MRKAGKIVGLAPALVIGLGMLGGCGQDGSGGKAQLTPAQACLQSLDPATGIEACRTAQETAPDDLALRKRIALLRLRAGQLPAARQAYQVVLAKAPNDAEAEFGLGLALENVGDKDGGSRKLEAVQKDPSVIDTFRKYGFSPLDLMTYDTMPVVVSGQSPEADRAMTPKQPFDTAVTVNVKCAAGLNGKLHDCVVISPLKPDQAAFGEAAKAIFASTRVRPASKKGAPVADAPVVLVYVFWPANYYKS